jgi:hypothetical protein
MRITAVSLVAAALFIAATASAQTTNWDERTAMPSTLPLWGSNVVIDNTPCCEELSKLPLKAGEDATILETMRDRAFRNGSLLVLKLEGNRSLKIVDCDDQCARGGEKFRIHELAAWWPKQRYYVVDVGLSEGRQTFLISERDGRGSRVFAPPVLSPSGRYGIAWDPSPAYGNGLQLIDMTADPPTMLDVKSVPVCPGTKQQYSLRPTPVWTDDSHITQ